MKTIFISLFDGVEGKNILRTSVMSSILADSGIKAVFLVRNKERADYLEKEFSGRRILYEIVKFERISKIDKFFSWLKYIPLDTETTRLRANMLLKMEKNYLNYIISGFFRRAFSNGIVRRLIRFSDFALVKNDSFSAVFEKYNPDLILTANLFEDLEVDFLREAKRRKIKSVAFINSWDRVTGRCMLRLLPDKFIVFNDEVKSELIANDDVCEEDIFVGGIPQYDNFFNKKHSERNDFFAKLGLDPGCRLMVYAPIGGRFSDSDWDMCDLLCRLNEEGKFGSGVKILVRFPPNDFIDESELKKRPGLLYDYPGTRFSSSRRADWDMDSRELAHLEDTLFHMSLMVCYASSISIDSAVCDKPVINLAFEIKKEFFSMKSPTQYYAYSHYKKALSQGGIKLVCSQEELIEAANAYLTDPSIDAEGRKKLVLQQCKFTDGKSGERIGNFILNFLKEKK